MLYMTDALLKHIEWEAVLARHASVLALKSSIIRGKEVVFDMKPLVLVEVVSLLLLAFVGRLVDVVTAASAALKLAVSRNLTLP